MAHRLGDGLEGAAIIGERILHARRHFGKDRASDDSVGFEFPQLPGQHPVTDTGCLAAQFGEALRPAAAHVADQDCLPLATDHREGGLHGTTIYLVAPGNAHAYLHVRNPHGSAFLPPGEPILSVVHIRISIIGAGKVGRALGGAWNAEHDVAYGVRNPQDAKHADLEGAAKTTVAAAQGADVVVLCTPWAGTEQAIADCGDLSGKVLIDCTNPLTPPNLTALEVGHTTSGAKQVAAWAPGARVCKAMNQIGAAMMDHPQLAGIPLMLICGDDDAAKQVTSDLLAALSFEVVDAGDLTLARLPEPYALIWIHLAYSRGLGTGFVFGLLRT